jgi:hypothetical protein
MNWNNIRGAIFGGGKKDFLQNYCSPMTIDRLNGNKNISYFRNIASTITEILPDAPHDTPGWSYGPYPIISVGHAQRFGLGLKIMKPRFGLCLEEKDLKFWSDEDLLSELKEITNGEKWQTWRQGEYFCASALDLLQNAEVKEVLKSQIQSQDVKQLKIVRDEVSFEIPLLYPPAIHLANRAQNHRLKRWGA